MLALGPRLLVRGQTGEVNRGYDLLAPDEYGGTMGRSEGDADGLRRQQILHHIMGAGRYASTRSHVHYPSPGLHSHRSVGVPPELAASADGHSPCLSMVGSGKGALAMLDIGLLQQMGEVGGDRRPARDHGNPALELC